MHKDRFEFLFEKRARKIGDKLMNKFGFSPKFLKEENVINIPSGLSDDLLSWHENIVDPLYKVGTLAEQGRPVPVSLVVEAMKNLENLYNNTRVEEERAELDNLLLALTDQLKEQDPIALQTKIDQDQEDM